MHRTRFRGLGQTPQACQIHVVFALCLSPVQYPDDIHEFICRTAVVWIIHGQRTEEVLRTERVLRVVFRKASGAHFAYLALSIGCRMIVKKGTCAHGLAALFRGVACCRTHSKRHSESEIQSVALHCMSCYEQLTPIKNIEPQSSCKGEQAASRECLYWCDHLSAITLPCCPGSKGCPQVNNPSAPHFAYL